MTMWSGFSFRSSKVSNVGIKSSATVQQMLWSDVNTSKVELGKGLTLASFSEDMFLELCIFLGCALTLNPQPLTLNP